MDSLLSVTSEAKEVKSEAGQSSSSLSCDVTRTLESGAYKMAPLRLPTKKSKNKQKAIPIDFTSLETALRTELDAEGWLEGELGSEPRC